MVATCASETRIDACGWETSSHRAPTVWNQTPVGPTSAASQREHGTSRTEAGPRQTDSCLPGPQKPSSLPCRGARSLVPTASIGVRVLPSSPPSGSARLTPRNPGRERILLRAAGFLVPASSLLALLTLIASHRLGLGSGGYGLLLAALGLGAIAGALVLPRVRTRLSINTLVALASGSCALVLAAVALLHHALPVPLLLIPAGVAWVVPLSTLNASLQLFLPAWVRGCSLAVYPIVLFGSQALRALHLRRPRRPPRGLSRRC